MVPQTTAKKTTQKQTETYTPRKLQLECKQVRIFSSLGKG